MAKSNEKQGIDASTEEKIKEAARVVFTRKGFVSTTVRDIAAEADINLALVNYYFRSKQKLFDLIMIETIEKLFSEIMVIVMDESTSLNKKIELIVDHYIGQLLNNPDFPLFIVNEILSGSNKFPAFIKNAAAIKGSYFFKQLNELNMDKELEINPIHILMNIIGLIIFPFLGRRVLEKAAGVEEDDFRDLMEERKKLIPIWIGKIIEN
ncbi:TetR/AcrR family transcriptional regulator [Albibacterium bauzanense]|uniref:TetR family transcriptional regulator n=1 Tax=Albibacterium bauzanense TaxID=653929 RepID=A0A4R1LYS8_9SPHI|nr:TetR/AcrR family transcriptional regulator [Albibacterium bauzanense]TCK84726.1 TetR family transcriptional regulator [Albibacterium bauzanense]